MWRPHWTLHTTRYRDGPDEELEHVRQALADTMAHAYREIRARWRSGMLPDLRTAALVVAIDTVAASYEAVGIFP